MAEIMRGSRRGKQVVPHQWANDWISFTDGSTSKISSVLLTADELREIKRSQDNGQLFVEYQDYYDPVLGGFLFKRKKRGYVYN